MRESRIFPTCSALSMNMSADGADTASVSVDTPVDTASIDFERLGEKLMKSAVSYSACDSVYTHPETNASLYIGNINAAQSKDILAERTITHVVNCQDMCSSNYHEADPAFTYLRFPISRWEEKVLSKESTEQAVGSRVLLYLQPLFDFCDHALAIGCSVLLHCRAGAHRAGTAGTALLMWRNQMNCMDALALAKTRRPVVDPFSHLLQLLQMLSEALGHAPVSASVDEIAKEKYLKMLKIGVPRASVEQKMRAHGHENMIATLPN